MTDDGLRAAERRWLCVRSPTHKARWLLERLRIRRLSPGDVVFAAFVHDEAAVLIAGSSARWNGDPLALVEQARADLGRKRAVVNGLLRGAEANFWLTPILERVWRPVLESIESWIACPGRDHHDAAVSTWASARAIDPETFFGVALGNICKAFGGSPIAMEIHVPLAIEQLRREGLVEIEALVALGVGDWILIERGGVGAPPFRVPVVGGPC